MVTSWSILHKSSQLRPTSLPVHKTRLLSRVVLGESKSPVCGKCSVCRTRLPLPYHSHLLFQTSNRRCPGLQPDCRITWKQVRSHALCVSACHADASLRPVFGSYEMF